MPLPTHKIVSSITVAVATPLLFLNWNVAHAANPQWTNQPLGIYVTEKSYLNGYRTENDKIDVIDTRTHIKNAPTHKMPPFGGIIKGVNQGDTIEVEIADGGTGNDGSISLDMDTSPPVGKWYLQEDCTVDYVKIGPDVPAHLDRSVCVPSIHSTQ